jgi:hypothetical protein
MIIIKSADASNAEDLNKLAEIVARHLDAHSAASVEWLQSSAATSSFASHRLTAIVKWYTPKGDAQ